MEIGKDATISFGGLSSGLDTNSIVPALVDKSRAPMRKIEQQQEILNSHQELLQTVIGMMTGLGDQAHRMDSISKVLAQRASSSDEGVVMATAGEGAAHGTYHIEIDTLATGDKLWSRPLASATQDDLLAEGSLSWTYRNDRVEVAVPEKTSLQALADAVNRTAKGAMARILFDGTNYRLQLEGSQTGSEGKLDLVEEGVGLNFNGNMVRQASNASFTVDQLPMTRTSNVVHDVIDGVTLVFGEEHASAVVRVSSDPGAIVEAVSDFVGCYNAVMEAIELASKPSRELERGRMVGDTALRNLQQTLTSAVTAPVAGLAGKIRSLAEIGVSSTKEGRLTVDVPRLREVLRQDPYDVARVFSRDRAMGTQGVAIAAQKVVDSYTMPMTGVLPNRVRTMDQQRSANEARLVQLQTSLDKYEAHLRDQFSTLERNMTKMKSQKEFLDQQVKSMNPK